MNHDYLKEILPPLLIRKLRGMRHGWHGDFKTWEEAKSKCTGYDSEVILDKVKKSLLKVKNGEAVYERDSVLFTEIQYSFPVLSALMWIAAMNKGALNIMDFGGSLGSSYFQNKHFLDGLETVHWCIVEQPSFVNAGKEHFEDEHLHFFNDIPDCTGKYRIDAVLFSSVLQYLENPFKVLEEVSSLGIKYIIIDRTPFVTTGRDHITIQKVPPTIYKASYPCWFFDIDTFKHRINPSYEIICEFPALDQSNLKSDFKGFILKLKQ